MAKGSFNDTESLLFDTPSPAWLLSPGFDRDSSNEKGFRVGLSWLLASNTAKGVVLCFGATGAAGGRLKDDADEYDLSEKDGSMRAGVCMQLVSLMLCGDCSDCVDVLAGEHEYFRNDDSRDSIFKGWGRDGWAFELAFDAILLWVQDCDGDDARRSCCFYMVKGRRLVWLARM